MTTPLKVVADTRQRCGCGCGQVVRKGSTYIRGHWARTKEGRERSRHTGRTPSEPIPAQVSWSDDDVVMIMRLVGCDDDVIERAIEAMAWKRGEA